MNCSGFCPIFRDRPALSRIPALARPTVLRRRPVLYCNLPPPLRFLPDSENCQHSALDTFPLPPGALPNYSNWKYSPLNSTTTTVFRTDRKWTSPTIIHTVDKKKSFNFTKKQNNCTK